MQKIELVVFDMAGTTVQDNHEVEACFLKTAEKVGLNVTADRVLALQGYSKIEVIKMLWKEANPNINALDFVENVDHTFLTFCDILEKHYENSIVKPTEGCLRAFAFLKDNGIKIGLTTGFYRKVTNIILDKLGWLENLDENYLGYADSIIDVSIASDEVAKGRPEPDMILKAMQLLQINDTKKIISIGDTPSDLISGKKANCYKTYGVVNGTHVAEQLMIYPNDGLLKNVGELVKLINTI